MSLGTAIGVLRDVTQSAAALRREGFAACASPFLQVEDVGLSEAETAELIQRHRWLGRTRRLPWSNCLTRSLALCRWARRRGFAPQLVIGTDRQDGDFMAHAWVQVAGREFGRNGYEAMRHGRPTRAES
ncbi:MAG: lasso peptide biosynthesis B2 protein [Pseudomonadota bacterium]